MRQGVSRSRRVVLWLLPGKPAVVGDPAMAAQLGRRARTVRAQPADLAAVLAVRLAANRGIRTCPFADVPWCNRRTDTAAIVRAAIPEGDSHAREARPANGLVPGR